MAHGPAKPNADASWHEDTATESESSPSAAVARRAHSLTGGENAATDSGAEVAGVEHRTEAGSPTAIRKTTPSFGATTDSDPVLKGDEDTAAYPLLNRVRRVIRRFRITREGDDVH